MAQLNWSLLGSSAQEIVYQAVGRNADGRLEVFTIADGALWHIWHTWQITPGSWG